MARIPKAPERPRGPRALLLGLAAVSLAGACRAEATPSAGSCSAAGVAAPPEQRALPEAVRETRAEIVERARACDYEGLARLARRHGQFRSSFGGGAKVDLADRWRKLEAHGTPVLRDIVLALTTRPKKNDKDSTYVWPWVAGGSVSSEDVAELQRVFPRVDRMVAMNQYFGLRIGIDSQGRWLYAVEGD